MKKFMVGMVCVMGMMVGCTPQKICDDKSDAQVVQTKLSNFSGVWDYKVISFKRKECYRSSPLIKVDCDPIFEKTFSNRVIITDTGNMIITIGVDDKCSGKNFDGHLVATCDYLILGPGTFTQYDLKLIDDNNFIGTVRQVFGCDKCAMTTDFWADVSGTKK